MSNDLITRDVYRAQKKLKVAITSAQTFYSSIPAKDTNCQARQTAQIAKLNGMITYLNLFGQTHREHVNPED